MVILNYRSPYLWRILSTDLKKNDGTFAHIKLSNILQKIVNKEIEDLPEFTKSDYIVLAFFI